MASAPWCAARRCRSTNSGPTASKSFAATSATAPTSSGPWRESNSSITSPTPNARRGTTISPTTSSRPGWSPRSASPPNIKRLVYTGTIDSYYAGAKAGTITEATPLDPDIQRRNYYARSKATAEDILTDMGRNRQLPLVILRPGIVIGRGGGPFHWGVGRFSKTSARCGATGRNKLPFVLVSRRGRGAGAGHRGARHRGQDLQSDRRPAADGARISAGPAAARRPQAIGIYQPIWKFYLADLAKWAVKVLVRHPDRIRQTQLCGLGIADAEGLFRLQRTRTELGWKPASDRQRMVDEGIGVALQPWLEATR